MGRPVLPTVTAVSLVTVRDAGPRWGPMASGRGIPLPAAAVLRSGLSPDQKKEGFRRATCPPGIYYVSHLPTFLAGIFGQKTTVALLQGLTWSHYTQLLKIWEGKAAPVLCLCALLTKPRSCQLANLFFFFNKFHVSLFLNVLSPGSVFPRNSSTT